MSATSTSVAAAGSPSASTSTDAAGARHRVAARSSSAMSAPAARTSAGPVRSIRSAMSLARSCSEHGSTTAPEPPRAEHREDPFGPRAHQGHHDVAALRRRRGRARPPSRRPAARRRQRVGAHGAVGGDRAQRLVAGPLAREALDHVAHEVETVRGSALTTGQPADHARPARRGRLPRPSVVGHELERRALDLLLDPVRPCQREAPAAVAHVHVPEVGAAGSRRAAAPPRPASVPRSRSIGAGRNPFAVNSTSPPGSSARANISRKPGQRSADRCVNSDPDHASSYWRSNEHGGRVVVRTRSGRAPNTRAQNSTPSSSMSHTPMRASGYASFRKRSSRPCPQGRSRMLAGVVAAELAEHLADALHRGHTGVARMRPSCRST